MNNPQYCKAPKENDIIIKLFFYCIWLYHVCCFLLCIFKHIEPTVVVWSVLYKQTWRSYFGLIDKHINMFKHKTKMVNTVIIKPDKC